MQNIELSLLVPCFNEASHLEKNLKRLKEVLDSSVFTYEIIIIDDASLDRTVKIIEEFISFNNAAGNIKFIRHDQNKGRGKTVGDGIMAAQGEVVGFIDIDLSTSPWYIFPLVVEIKKGVDVILGLRIYKLKFKTFYRWILSKGYKFLVKLFLGVDLGDTESGCKFFRRDKILPVLSLVQDEKWFWDTEIMTRSYLAGLKISQLPTVFIRESLYTSVKIFSDSCRYFINLVNFSRRIRRELKAKK